jgi:hypothetical protein
VRRAIVTLFILLCVPISFATQTGKYRESGGATLNDLKATPGDTLDVSLDELCTSGYTQGVRNVPSAAKKQACAAYGVAPEHCNGKEYEIDHLISLELGGSNDPKNLWPQPYQPKPGAREKDRLENWLHKQVCDGTISLADAQQEIANDWYAAYLQMLAGSAAPQNPPAEEAPSPTGPTPTTVPSVTAVPSASSGAEGAAWDFAISQDYLAQLETGHSIQPGFTLKLGDHSAVHKLQDDCEMHAAASPQSLTFGSPNDVVVEPPNVCKNAPSAAGASGNDWGSVFDSFNSQNCQVTGFPRIFTEHASGSTGASNPNHVFEIHPMTGLNCGGQQLSFGSLLKVYPGMRAISPSTTEACIGQRQLFVRFDVDQQQYVFREQGGRCGNFAIVEVQNVLTSTIRSVGGGHSAIARVSPNGQSLATLKIYTLSPSADDSWLSQLSPSHNGGTRVLLHGLFTYDYFAIQRVVHPKGQDWQRPPDWVPVPYPLAFVVFGQADSPPWSEE